MISDVNELFEQPSRGSSSRQVRPRLNSANDFCTLIIVGEEPLYTFNNR